MGNFCFLIIASLLLCQARGLPASGEANLESTPRVKDWITFSPWSFPSLPSLFRDGNSNEDPVKLMKKRIEKLEKAQESMLELLKSLTAGVANFSCSPEKQTSIVGYKKPIENKDKKPQVSTTSAALQTSTSIATTASQLEATEKPIIPNEDLITTPSTDDEIQTLQSIQVPPNEVQTLAKNSIVISDKNLNNKNLTEIKIVENFDDEKKLKKTL